jgi:hypothetical protein
MLELNKRFISGLLNIVVTVRADEGLVLKIIKMAPSMGEGQACLFLIGGAAGLLVGGMQ